MLVLTRKENEKIRIGADIVLTVVRTSGDRVRIGIEAPINVQVLRSELSEWPMAGGRRPANMGRAASDPPTTSH